MLVVSPDRCWSSSGGPTLSMTRDDPEMAFLHFLCLVLLQLLLQLRPIAVLSLPDSILEFMCHSSQLLSVFSMKKHFECHVCIQALYICRPFTVGHSVFAMKPAKPLSVCGMKTGLSLSLPPQNTPSETFSVEALLPPRVCIQGASRSLVLSTGLLSHHLSGFSLKKGLLKFILPGGPPSHLV